MKKTLILITILLIPSVSYAGISVCFDVDSTVREFSLRGNQLLGCTYYNAGQNVTQAKYDTVRNLLQTVERRYLKKLGNDPVEMSPAEKVAVDDALAASLNADILARRQQLGTVMANSNTADFSLTQIDTAIDNIQNLADAKVFLKKLVRGVIKLTEANQ